MKKTSQYESFFSYAPDYLEFLRLEKKSPRTIASYGFNLNNFKDYLVRVLGKKARCIEVDDVSDNDVRRYLSEIVDNGNSLNTRNARLNTVRRYIDFCADRDIRFVKLAEDVAKITSKPVKPEDHLWLTKEQMELVLKQPKRNRLGIRDRMILLFLFGTGARLREFRHITLDDLVLDGDYPYVRLYGKGDKKRLVPITKELKENLEYYISLFHKDSDKDTPLFYTKIHGQINRMSDDNVQRICAKYGNMAREKDPSMRKLHPHICRYPPQK